MANGKNTRYARGILARFSEPSTWAGLAILAGMFGVQVAPETMHEVIQAGASVAGTLAVILPEAPGE